jgi:ABC-type lipoprotein export system ATPase subunit
MTYRALVESKTIAELMSLYPVARDFLLNYNLEKLPEEYPFPAALAYANEDRLREFGCAREDLIEQLVQFLDTMLLNNTLGQEIRSLTILGGRDKQGQPEEVQLTIHTGDIVSIVGPTGSGKSRLLGDIECIAQRDTPTQRQILINGRALDDDERFGMEGRLVAQLSQNMNFVVDLSVAEFLEMHAKSRFSKETELVVRQCFECANELAGEKFTLSTKVTQLSGGQSRALMIADTAFMSASPIVLIDEIENAGIDRKQAVSLLAGREKIVLISTHDPLLALSADKRIVIQGGGILKIVEASETERRSLASIEALDRTLMSVRRRLRMGEVIMPEDF